MIFYNGFNLMVDLILVSVTAYISYRNGFIRGGTRALQALLAGITEHATELTDEEAREMQAEYLFEQQREREHEKN